MDQHFCFGEKAGSFTLSTNWNGSSRSKAHSTGGKLYARKLNGGMKKGHIWLISSLVVVVSCVRSRLCLCVFLPYMCVITKRQKQQQHIIKFAILNFRCCFYFFFLVLNCHIHFEILTISISEQWCLLKTNSNITNSNNNQSSEIYKTKILTKSQHNPETVKI